MKLLKTCYTVTIKLNYKKLCNVLKESAGKT